MAELDQPLPVRVDALPLATTRDGATVVALQGGRAVQMPAELLNGRDADPMVVTRQMTDLLERADERERTSRATAATVANNAAAVAADRAAADAAAASAVAAAATLTYADEPTAIAGIVDDEVLSPLRVKQSIEANAPSLPFAVPIGGSGSGQVPSNLRERFKHLANAKTDFGVQPWVDGVPNGTLKDNTAALQEAIDKIQPFGGALYIPPVESELSAALTGALVIRDGAGLDGKSIALIGSGAPNTTASLTSKFDYGNGLKLKADTNTSMFTIEPLAGHLIVENMNFDGYGSHQAAGHIFDFQNNDTGQYGFGPLFKNVYIASAKGSGIWQGRNRAKGLYDTVWVEYCFAHGGAPAWLVDSYDTEVIEPGVGSNAGIGMYLGVTAQFFMSGGAIWDSGSNNLIISDHALDAVIVGTSFDGAKAGHNVVVEDYTADSRLSARKFIGCTWRQRPHAGFANNTWDDLNFAGNTVSLVAPAFQGPTSGVDKVRYHVNGNGLIAMSNPSWGASSFATAAIGPSVAIRAAGLQDSYIGHAAGSTDVSVYRNGAEQMRFANRIMTYVATEASGATPRHWLKETDAPADSGRYMIDIDGGELRIFLANDAETTFGKVLSLTRSGTQVDRLALDVTGGKLALKGLPTSASGLSPGDIWIDAANNSVLKVVS